MASKSERLTILSEAEQFALYGLPDFDIDQRMKYLVFMPTELALVMGLVVIPVQKVTLRKLF